MKIVFVCSANACRSPMAEGFARKLLEENGVDHLEVTSAGLDAYEGAPATDEAIEVMKARGVDISSHRSKAFSPRIGKKDMVLTMTRSQKERILAEHPSLAGRVFMLNEYAKNTPRDIPDPFKGQVSYEAAADEIESSVRLTLGLTRKKA
ncbi:MAG TPA: low molecular weight protein arginine phosphatase [Conexivisphaerales archaeon]|nr:low molecular weight protein arginine phosphatase [Conexivisphaerales archaeon]